MAESEYQTEDETIMSEIVDTDTEETATVETDDVSKYRDTELTRKNNPNNPNTYEDAVRRRDERNIIKKIQERRRKAWKERCMDGMWTCEGESLWRIYMKSYMEKREKTEEENVPKWKMPSDVPKQPRVESTDRIFPPYECLPLGGFRHEQRPRTSIGLDHFKRTGIWKKLRTRKSTPVFQRYKKTPKIESAKWPCTTRDLVDELKIRERKKRKKRRDIFPCDPQYDDENDMFFLHDQRSDFANRKELSHVRVPVTCPEAKEMLLVDRAVGERPGLVDGDYVIVGFASKERNNVYANVVLRGLKGMHLPELSPLRERRNTWKFCFYQAVIALLAKTQLRYKYTWSANIDYIYDHAWTLYTHIGTINVREKQRLDDVVVYNYRYSIEIKLIQEMKDVPIVSEIDFNYEESDLTTQMTLKRKDPLKVRVELGCQKITESRQQYVHESVRKIEEWFDNLAVQYRNCIFRTTRFSLAFWQDGLFWYLYNPYRSDEFGLWDDNGCACIVKFCTRDSLRRHLMILLLRAYAYKIPKSSDSSGSSIGQIAKDTFDVQIFHVIFHCCQLHNLKLLQRKAMKSSDYIDECPYDLLEIGDQEDNTMDQAEEDDDDNLGKPREKATWLKCCRVTWSRCITDDRKKRSDKITVKDSKARWHQYYVEEFNKLFSLWGEMHITDSVFNETNRGMQMYACYVVCAGMTRIIAPEYWTPKILDVIVMCGDRYYTHSKLEAEFKSTKKEYAHVSCWDRYLANHFKIGDTLFESRVLHGICGRLYVKSYDCLWQSVEQMFSEHHFGILTCENACLGLFKFCGAYYMCDVNSFGPPLFQYGYGTVYLMRATSFYKFITILVLTIGSPECNRFTLNPIEILKVVEMDPIWDSKARRNERVDRHGKFAGKTCTLNGQKRRRVKK